MKRRGLIALLAVSSIFTTQCGILLRSRTVTLPPTHISPECEQYAVVDAAQMFIHTAPAHDAEITYLSRSGEIFDIIDKNRNQDQYYDWQAPWYLIRQIGLQGWAYGAWITTYCYQYQAELRSAFVLERDERR